MIRFGLIIDFDLIGLGIIVDLKPFLLAIHIGPITLLLDNGKSLAFPNIEGPNE